MLVRLNSVVFISEDANAGYKTFWQCNLYFAVILVTSNSLKCCVVFMSETVGERKSLLKIIKLFGRVICVLPDCKLHLEL
jgi:hypothetical protein